VPADPAPARFRYQKPLAEYVSIFDTPIRSIKRWIATGRSAGDLPPLDDPPAMAGWWVRRMRQRTPDKLLKFVTVEKKPVAVVESPAADAGADDEPLQQARANLRTAYAELTAARLPDDGGKIDESAVARAHRVWKEAAETFQSAQRGSDDTAKKRGELIAKSEILSSDADLAQQLRRIHETIPRNIDNRLADMPEDTRGRIRGAIDAEMATVHAVIRRLAEHIAHEFELAAL
jgi:hypothetical protein